ncbi:MAG: adenylate/guanylate cyclase domain-containing protein [Candidatus Korobacteraceae bacterium]|jgi:class 3 adenylate cyclase
MAHVLFMDIVAYSKLPMEEQTGLLRQLQQIVRETAEFHLAQEKDQLLALPTGDGMALVFFHDPESAVRCALEISHTLKTNSNLKLRMGIHTGPVFRVQDINAARNVAGGGINLAQRVMDCGDAGHILVSSAMADVLSDVRRWKATLHDLGEAEVKHGVRVHIFNLYTADAGNPQTPQKLRAAKTRKTIRRSEIVAGVLVLLAAAGFVWFLYAEPTVRTFDVIPGEATSGETVTLHWDVINANDVELELEQVPFGEVTKNEKDFKYVAPSTSYKRSMTLKLIVTNRVRGTRSATKELIIDPPKQESTARETPSPVNPRPAPTSAPVPQQEGHVPKQETTPRETAILTMGPAPTSAPVAQQGAPIPNFDGTWAEISPKDPAHPFRLKVGQNGARISLYISYTQSFNSVPFLEATISQGRATTSLPQGCAPKFQKDGYDYHNPGVNIFTVSLRGSTLVYEQETKWTSPCDGHPIGVEPNIRELQRVSQ